MSKLNGLEAIESQKVFLKFFGIWPLQQETLWYKSRYYITCAICLGFAAIPIIEIPNHLNDYKILSELVSLTVAPIVFCLKMITFKNSKTYFTNLIDNMKQNPIDAFDVDMLKALRMSKRLILIYPAWNIISIVVFLIKPLFETENFKQNLPVKFTYNLGRYKNLMYAYQVLGLGTAGVGLAVFDCLVINFINIGISKLEIMTKKIRNTATLHHSMIAKEFGNIITVHNEIIKYMYYLEHVFTYCFFAQFFNSIVVICNIGLQLAHVEIQSVEFAAMVMYFLSMFSELALYCWFGNEVIVKSQKILQACYECSWYEFDVSIRKSIFIIMERSKRPLILTAAKFATLSLQSFVVIIRNSYSFFTVMQRMYLKSKATAE